MHATNESRARSMGAMDTMARLWRSTVGRKALVAASGLLLSLWVVLHVAGNLTVFSGPAAADGYAASLREMPAALWAVRIGLVLAAVVHVAGVVSLTRADRAARPRHAVRAQRRATTWAARSMRVGGALLLGFVIFHLLHLTFGVAHPGFLPGHVYDNVVRGLHSPVMAAVYIGAALLLGLHLFHGLWAAVRSLGVWPDGAIRRRRPAVAALSAAVALGFASVPLAVVTGWLR
jgi:succinate dehydrogenase / fumarate reductase cytochrome b subunit